MTNRTKRWVSALSAAALAGGLMVAATSPASAATCPLITSIKANDIVTYGSSPTLSVVTIMVDDCNATGSVDARARWTLANGSVTRWYDDYFRFEAERKVKRNFGAASPVGFTTVKGEAEDADESISNHPVDSFYVRRNTYFSSFNASPEPVAKGAKIKITGKIVRLRSDGSYAGYPAHKYYIQFRPYGTTEWIGAGTYYTSSTGTFTKYKTAYEDGGWRAISSQTGHYARDYSRSDYVDVKVPAGTVYYGDCTEAEEAGAAPLYRGDVGYRDALDRDGDGIACEG